MQASISTSKRLIAGLLLFFLAGSVPAWAADPGTPPTAKDRTTQPEEDDYSSTPFTQYGEFNQQDDEEEDIRFFQAGRFFGVSLGIGFQGVTGNRGSLYQGGFPMFDVKLIYWFDFNFALALGLTSVSNYYNEPATTGLTTSGNHHDVNLFHLGLDLKYYFETRNLSAALSFANPYLMAGAGTYSKTDTNQVTSTIDTDGSLGFDVGAGLEFAVKPKKVYFAVEGRLHVVNFKDTYIGKYTSAGLPDLTGLFYTTSANFLFTW